MGLVPVVAFCAAMAAGDMAPSDPSGCVFVSDDYAFRTETACVIRATDIKDDRDILWSAYQALYVTLQEDPGQMRWYYWCVPDTELKRFYQELGVDADVPEPA